MRWGAVGLALALVAPLLLVDSAGASYFLGGGLGSVGGAASVGDSNYRGIFIHEQGHALSLPHQGDAYQAGKYPYVGGSLAGSAWGYDPDHHEFLGNRSGGRASISRAHPGDQFPH